MNSVVSIDASQFTNSTAGGTFAIVLNQQAKAVSLSFTPVPEPALVLLAALLVLVACQA